MPKNHHMNNRDGVWYYRRRVPKHLVSAFGKSTIYFSLKTKNFNEAAKRRNILDVEWDARFEQAEKHPDATLQTVSSLSRDEALKIVRDYVQETDLKFQKQEAKRGPVPEDIKRDIEIDLGISKQILEDPSSEEGLLVVGDAGEELIARHDIELDLKDPIHDEFFEFVRRALLEVYRRAVARHNQDFSHSFFDKLFAPLNANGNKLFPDISLSKTINEYLDDYERRASIKGVRKKRRHDIQVSTDLILEVMGASTHAQSVTRKMCREFVDILSKMPPNRHKKFKKLPLDKVLLIVAKEDLEPMKKATQSSYLVTLVNVLEFARLEGYIDRNPAEGLTPIALTVPDEEKRDPYTPEHLQKIFTAPIYTGCVNDERSFNKPGPNYPKRSRFWLPLISLFTGMRMNEICQLNLSDVKCTDAGTHYFHVFPDTEDQSVKNKSSRRKCPIHPMLIRLNLLDYIDDLRKKKETKAFPDIPAAKSTGYRSDVFTKRFATFQKGVGIPSKVGTFPDEQRFSFHSFRHNYRDELRNTGASNEIVELLGGWSSGNKAVHQNYGKGYTPDRLFKYVKKISYPGLDLSHLYPYKK